MAMNHLEQTIENFYLCTHLPIRAFTMEGKEIRSAGFLPGMTTYYEEVMLWLETLTGFSSPGTQLHFSPTPHIFFTLCTVGKTPTIAQGFLVIGPYTDHPSLKEEFAFKPAHCMPHLIELLYAIGKTHSTTAKTAAFEDYNYHIIRAQKYIKEHYAEPITLDILASHLSLNKSYLCTIFKQATKDSFCTYTNKIRIEESKKLLNSTNHSITDIALSVGFSSASYFNTIFKKLEGKTPLDHRREYSSEYESLAPAL